MRDPRIRLLAKNLVRNSCKITYGENVLIEMTGAENSLITALVEEIYAAGGNPFVWLKDEQVNRALMMGMRPGQAKILSENERALMAQMQAYIGIRSSDNFFELSDVPPEQHAMFMKDVWHKVHGEIRVPKTRWVVLRYPSNAMAQKAGMSTEAFEDYYFDVCCLDYGKMGKAMEALIERMSRTDRVRIIAKETDLCFSIKDIPAIKCAGDMNIPDGEVYTAPVRDSVNGVITYNTPSVNQGFTYENIRLEFKDGKIIRATANDTERINKIFDTDEGARFVGEFAIGVNPYINKLMRDTLFDEKIAGSIHFTPGSCYEDCENGNHSSIHWDLVLIQTPEYGGGEIYFDNELIRKDGLFVPKYLHCLNPENLK